MFPNLLPANLDVFGKSRSSKMATSSVKLHNGPFGATFGPRSAWVGCQIAINGHCLQLYVPLGCFNQPVLSCMQHLFYCLFVMTISHHSSIPFTPKPSMGVLIALTQNDIPRSHDLAAILDFTENMLRAIMGAIFLINVKHLLAFKTCCIFT